MARLWEFTAAAVNLRTLALALALLLLLGDRQALQFGQERALFSLVPRYNQVPRHNQ